MMHLSSNKAAIVKQALKEWQEQDLLTSSQVQMLSNTLHITPFDWRRVARYSFWIALICLIIASGAIVTDKALQELVALYFHAPVMAKCISFALLSSLLYGVAIWARRRSPERSLRNEALFFLGVMATAVFLGYFCEIFKGQDFISHLLLLACLTYACLGFVLESNLIWFFALLSFGSWMGAYTGYLSGWGAYYLGMNYPVRFTLLGGGLVASAFLFLPFKSTSVFYKTTLVMGLLYLFISLWILSIFGNYGELENWYLVKQSELFYWSILFGFVALAAIGHGIVFDNTITRGFGWVFLVINLYTRFFEYFWQPLHKAVFFAILGGSFWYLGSYAERLWNLSLRLQRSSSKEVSHEN